MGQVTITVSIDARGNLVCPDMPGNIGESITWVPDGTTVLSIQSITATTGSFNPAPSAANSWTGSLATDGSFGGTSMGIQYTIIVNPKNVSAGQKQKSPKINIISPIEAQKKPSKV